MSNVERFSGFADLYNGHRPRMPESAVRMLLSLADKTGFVHAVDLGSGTGLSSKSIGAFAGKVTGVEPNDDMRAEAERANAGEHISYTKGDSAATGLPSACADCVICSQSFHWMEPASALAEINRILMPGGIFAAIDNDWPPLLNASAEKEYNALFSIVEKLSREYAHLVMGCTKYTKYTKEKHLENIKASKYFDYCREMVFHHEEPCTAERFTGLAMSQGALQDMLKSGIEEMTPVIGHFIFEIREIFKGRTLPMFLPYRMRIGVKI